MPKKFFTKNKIITIIILVVAALGVGFWYTRSGKAPETVNVVRGSIFEEVILTGKTEAAQNIDLSFDRAGRIAEVSANVGDRVNPGQVLAKLDSSDLSAQLDSSLANIKMEQAKLDQLKKGTLSDGGTISSSAVVGAENDLRDADEALLQALSNSYTKADDAVRNLTDTFFENPRTPNANYNFSDVTTEELIDLSFTRRKIEDLLVNWEAKFNALSLSSDPIVEYSYNLNNLFVIRAYLDRLSKVVNSVTSGVNTTAEQLSISRSNISSARLEVNAAITNLQAARQEQTSAKNRLDSVLVTPEELTIGEAGIEQAKADADQIRAQIRKNSITSPISGLVTRQDAKVGETVNIGVNVVAVMSDGSFLIEANVPEVEVGKIVVGDKVAITLDAYVGEDWTGQITYIEPAETLVDGVVNYKVKVSFDKNDPRLKSGLTANLKIKTSQKENVLILPQYAIKETDKGTFVEKAINDKESVEVPVTIGVRSQDGRVEILSGLVEGDIVQTSDVK